MSMRYGFFWMSVLMFVVGIGFILVGERTVRRAAIAPVSAEERAAPPVATVHQLMTGLIEPAAEEIWDAVSITVSREGTVEKRPTTDEEWTRLATSAALLIESSTLLLQGGRAVDMNDWARYSRELAKSSQVALEAAQKRDADAIFEVSEVMYRSCTGCHEGYLRN